MAGGDWCTAQPGGGLLIASRASAGIEFIGLARCIYGHKGNY